MKQQKTRLTYSDKNGVIEEGPAPEALIVCIVQVVLHRRNHLEPTIIRPLSEVQVNGDLVSALIRGDVEP